MGNFTEETGYFKETSPFLVQYTNIQDFFVSQNAKHCHFLHSSKIFILTPKNQIHKLLWVNENQNKLDNLIIQGQATGIIVQYGIINQGKKIVKKYMESAK